MRRLTIWITATLAVVALVIAYQLNATGVGAKGGNEGDHGGSQPTCATAPANSTSTPAACPPGAPAGSAGSSGAPAPSGSAGSTVPGKDDDRGTNDQDGKPGENK